MKIIIIDQTLLGLSAAEIAAKFHISHNDAIIIQQELDGLRNAGNVPTPYPFCVSDTSEKPHCAPLIPISPATAEQKWHAFESFLVNGSLPAYVDFVSEHDAFNPPMNDNVLEQAVAIEEGWDTMKIISNSGCEWISSNANSDVWKVFSWEGMLFLVIYHAGALPICGAFMSMGPDGILCNWNLYSKLQRFYRLAAGTGKLIPVV